MVLEYIFKVDVVEKRPWISFFYGIFFTFVGWIFSIFLFPDNISLSMIFLITMLLIPSLMKLLSHEESLEKKHGMKNFFKNHKDVIEVYLFTFLGVFFAYLIISLISVASVFDFQDSFLDSFDQDYESFFAGKVQEPFQMFQGVLTNNIVFLVICFLLSFFYGASAIFLIILNASVFARFVSFLFNNTDLIGSSRTLMFFFFHMIPEVSGFLLAAIAGGVVSKAVVKEFNDKKALKNVIKDATLLLIFACVLIILGALIESYVTTTLFLRFF